MKIFTNLLFFLSPHEKRRGGLLLAMILIMAMLDMLGVASIMPLIALLTNPELIETNVIFKSIFKASSILGVETAQEFMFAFGTFFFILFLTSISFKALTTYATLKFSQKRYLSISKRLMKIYLHQPYSWFLNRNSSEIGKTIFSEVGLIVGSGIKPMMNLLTQIAIILTLLILLVLVDPKLTVIVCLTLSVLYGIIYKVSRNFLNLIGKERFKSNQIRFSAISEAFGAAKEIKVGGLEQTFVKKFKDASETFIKHEISASAIRQLPRYALEAIAFGGIFLVILYLMKKSTDFTNILPILALYTFAGYRLMPSIQRVYADISTLRYAQPAIDAVYDDTKGLELLNKQKNKTTIQLNKSITLKHIHFQYSEASRTALKDINLNISANSTVGLVGATGSGKTTLVDIVLGLLEPNKGSLEVDGEIINKDNRRNWQQSIGYVPQFIYLSDDTIEANIAFGVDPKDINKDAILSASKIANLHDFVINELPKKYQTYVGERGVRLSGGQRQRIGIARALYHNPKLLVLDEATSSLDNLTEKFVMEAIHNLEKKITIILIAHRLSTVKKCDKIILLDKGQVIEEGTFEKLIKSNEQFKKSAENT